jgi:hypothetical protein
MGHRDQLDEIPVLIGNLGQHSLGIERTPRRLRPSGRACRKAIRSALAEDWAKVQEQSQRNRNQHGNTSRLVTDLQSALAWP